MAIQDFIRAQPAIVASVLHGVREALRPWPRPACRRILLVGSGTSQHALMAMAQALEEGAGVPVSTLGPNRFLAIRDKRAEPGDLVVVLSQSGASATSVAAARMAVGAGATTLVLTGEASSPIASVAGARIIAMHVGPEPIGPKTKGYTASLAALEALRQFLAPQPADAIGIKLDIGAVDKAQRAARQLAPELDELDYVLVAGSGRHEATALEASLKISEIAGLPAAGFDTEEALHGRLHALSHRSLALFIAADPAELELAERAGKAMAKRGARLHIANLTSRPSEFDWMRVAEPLPAPLDALSAILPFQWLAVLLALRRGLDPDTMRYPDLSQALAIKLAS
jgi:glucosamine--fructose-6-phosphate aminotransferase (isomerizing)